MIVAADDRCDTIVVGAGVSGCACAGALAARGLDVMLVGAALDVTGMPGYGPLVCGTIGGGTDDLVEALEALPGDQRCAWLKDALVVPRELARELSQTGPEGSRGRREVVAMLVDPRSVSIRTKWTLEQYPRLRLRQALITGMEQLQGGGWALQSAFGEFLVARRVVLAVGLALGGRVDLGRRMMMGGRYGETGADVLWESLRRLGVRTRESRLRVAAEWGAADAAVRARTGEALALTPLDADGSGDADELPQTLEAREDRAARWARACAKWRVECRTWAAGARGSERAAAPELGFSLESRGLRREQVAYKIGVRSADAPWCGGRKGTVLVPAGLATGEWQEAGWSAGEMAGDEGAYGREQEVGSRRGDADCELHVGGAAAAPGGGPGVAEELGRGGVSSRPPYGVSGRVVAGVNGESRIAGLDEVWAVGRLAGAASYVESLRSGTRVAAALAAATGPGLS